MVTGISALIIGAVSLWLLVAYAMKGMVLFPISPDLWGELMFLTEVAVAVFILYMGYKYRNYIAIVFILILAGLRIFYEFGIAHPTLPQNNLFVDQLSIIMALVIGIVGSSHLCLCGKLHEGIPPAPP